jgi:arginine utilization protein RocB
MEYSTQTPYRAAALYNVFLMKRGAEEVMHIFTKVAEDAAKACNRAYSEICKREGVNPVGKVTVLSYEELLLHAEKKLGSDVIARIKANVLTNTKWDDREKSIRIVDSLMIECQELGPVMVLLFAPPYYPAVNTSKDPLIIDSIHLIKEIGREQFNLEVNQIHYFNGICDLSYVSYDDKNEGWTMFERNTPVWGDTYSIPFAEMQDLQGPVLNVGPFGKDAHKRTERLHIESAFVQLPVMLETLVRSLFPIKLEACKCPDLVER